MAKRKTNRGRITHTEILSLAIQRLEIEIAHLDERYDLCTFEGKEALREADVGPLREKRQLLMQLYAIETGTEYETQ